MSLIIHRRDNSDYTSLQCRGRLTLGEATAAFREAVDALGPDIKRLVLDFSEVTYIDSAGLGEMVRLKSHCDATGTAVLLAGATGRTLSLLQLTKLATLFPLTSPTGEETTA